MNLEGFFLKKKNAKSVEKTYLSEGKTCATEAGEKNFHSNC